MPGKTALFEISEIASAASGKVYGDVSGSVSGISTDSRTARPGELFVALKGEKFDGHDYIPQLAESGIAVLMLEDGWQAKHKAPEGVTCITVKNTLKALGDLAHCWRSRFSIPVIGVTGSNGKTTTKEMLASILRLTGEGLATEGNLNNLIGLPQMLFRLNSEHKWAVLEMGMSERGEIDRLAEIAAPQTGIVLNAFPAHLASMGTVEAVAAAKGELLHRIADKGLAVVNADDPKIASLSQNPSARRVSFGLKRGEVRAEDVKSLGKEGQSFSLITPTGRADVILSAFGTHNIYNAIAAAAALYERLPLEQIVEGLSTFTPYKGRFRMEEFQGITIIDDTYNANPASTGAALATLAELKGNGRAFVALGDMLELGVNEVELHRAAGVQAAQVADRLYLFGELARNAADGAVSTGMPAEAVNCCKDHEEVADDILRQARPGDIVLLKGSRGMKMERVAGIIRDKGFHRS